jgi:hypothetical protein
MNMRLPRYKRWSCLLEPTVIDQIKALADAHAVSYLEMTRRLIHHSLTCKRFNPKRTDYANGGSQ